MFSVIPIEEPGDFSISINNGPLEFLIESTKLERKLRFYLHYFWCLE
jgi:hypothetical protein